MLPIAAIFLALAAIVALRADNPAELIAAAFLALVGVALIVAGKDTPQEAVW